eukprot:11641082-Karenia_brevis.AAC.1
MSHHDDYVPPAQKIPVEQNPVVEESHAPVEKNPVEQNPVVQLPFLESDSDDSYYSSDGSDLLNKSVVSWGSTHMGSLSDMPPTVGTMTPRSLPPTPRTVCGMSTPCSLPPTPGV